MSCVIYLQVKELVNSELCDIFAGHERAGNQ